jgi:hypothetical protein
LKVDAELALWSWGRWVSGGGRDGGGINILYRCEKEGAGASHSTVPGEPHMPPTVELVEKFCCQLKRERRHVYRAVMHYFVGRESSEIAAKKLKITTDVFDSRIHHAVTSLDEYMGY